MGRGVRLTAGAKRDRTARLLRVTHLLYQHPAGLKPHDIARLCQVCLRTTYRDLLAMQGELDLPVWQDGAGRYGLDHGHFLPPVKLTLLEATALFLAARLACKYGDEREPSLTSAFAKLATVLPPSIAQHVQATVGDMAAKTANETYARVFDVLATAWAGGRRVRIWYAHPGAAGGPETVAERLLDPYFLEPSAIGHACYVIGHDHRSGQVRTFKLERVRDIELTAETFVVPEGWSAAEYLSASWGVMHDEAVEVRVRFSPAAASRVREAVWHPSQTLSDQADGSLLFSARVAGTLEIARWLLTWGAEAEVLSPPALREYVADSARAQLALYALPADMQESRTLL
ncbi:MAG: helix-turn-helix transcriptional regulator [Chloroflexota bacterium]